MTRRIEREVAANRRSQRLLESYFLEPSPDQTAELRVPPTEITVVATADVETRPLNDTLTVGARGEAQTVGRGRVGDYRGDWTTATTASGEFVAGGRAALVEALAGGSVVLAQSVLGNDGSPPSTDEESLRSPADIVDAWIRSDGSSTIAVSTYRVTDLVDVVREAGVRTDDGTLAVRLTVDDDLDVEEAEVRVRVDLSYESSTLGDAALTDRSAIVRALVPDDQAVGIAQLAVGTGSSDPAANDTSLENEVLRATVTHETGGDTLRTAVLLTRSEPATQPVDFAELGLLDQNGNLVARQTYLPERKDDRIALRVVAGLVID